MSQDERGPAPPRTIVSLPKRARLPGIRAVLCPTCNNTVRSVEEDTLSGEFVCGTCGLLISERVKDSRVHSTNVSGSNGAHSSSVTATPGPLSNATILSTAADQSSQETSSDLSTLLSQNLHIQVDGDASSSDLIDLYCQSLSLSNPIRDFAKLILMRIREAAILPQMKLELRIGSCLVFASRQLGRDPPITFAEVGDLMEEKNFVVGQSYKRLEAKLKVRRDLTTNTNSIEQGLAASTTPSLPEDFLPEFCTKLNVNADVQNATRHVIVTARVLNIEQTRKLESRIGAAIAFTTRLFGAAKSNKEISEAVGVGVNPIRLVYKALVENKERLVQQAWLESGRAKWENLAS